MRRRPVCGALRWNLRPSPALLAERAAECRSPGGRQRCRGPALHLSNDRQAQGRGPHLRGLRHNTETLDVHVLRMTPDDVVVGCLPLFHVFGQTCAMGVAVRSGASLTLIPRFDPQAVLEAIARYRATVFEGVPTMARLLHHPRTQTQTATEADEYEHEYEYGRVVAPDVRLRRRVTAGGGAARLREALRVRRAGGLRHVSETSPVVTFNHLDRPRKAAPSAPRSERRGPAAGRRGLGRAARQIGELAVRGPNLMKGYWKPSTGHSGPIAVPDGWLRTGDLVPARTGDATSTSSTTPEGRMIIRDAATTSTRVRSRRSCDEHPSRRPARRRAGCPAPGTRRGDRGRGGARPGTQATAGGCVSTSRTGSPRTMPPSRVAHGRVADGVDRQGPQAGDHRTGHASGTPSR